MAPPAVMEPELVTFRAGDGFPIAATWFAPARAPERIVLVAPATAVRRRLYEGFARYLTARGAGVLTWDWRGTGDSRPKSLRGFRADMRDWAEKDFGGAVAWVRERHAGPPLVAVGHSFGGQAVGLVPGRDAFRALVAVAAQSGYYGHWPAPRRYLYVIFWYFWMPFVTRLFGYFPGRLLRMGEDLPSGVALQWARWCRSPDYLGDWRGHAAFGAPILAWSFADDPYATRRSVEALLEHYERAAREHRHLAPRDAGVPRIGHFGFFRPGIETLWREAAEWIAARATGSGSS